MGFIEIFMGFSRDLLGCSLDFIGSSLMCLIGFLSISLDSNRIFMDLNGR